MQNNSFLADVILPLRNMTPFIVPALQSILCDTGLGTLIVVDLGATDDWEERAGPYLRLGRAMVLRPRPSTLAAALNQALTLSTTPFVALMDPHCTSVPGRLTAQINWMEAHPVIAALGTQVTPVNARNQACAQSAFPTKPADMRKSLLRSAHAAACFPSVMLRRKSILDAGGFREGHALAESYDLLMRLSEVGAVANLRECYLHERPYMNQLLSLPKLRRSFRHDIALLAARERAASKPDPTSGWRTAPQIEELLDPSAHPVIHKLAVAYHALETSLVSPYKPFPPDAMRAIRSLIPGFYLSDHRRDGYALMKKAAITAVKRANLGEALEAYCALARCRASDALRHSVA